jgi:DNA-binding Lrp family transcriptional regulator
MDELDKKIVNHLQKGFPISENPYAEVALELGIGEKELLKRLQHLLDEKVLSRFGPMYDVEKLGGAFSLVAMKVPPDQFDQVAELVNRYPQVAHNYQREHELNMWYVLATESAQEIDEINNNIEQQTGLKVFNMPKLAEFYIGLQLSV